MNESADNTHEELGSGVGGTAPSDLRPTQRSLPAHNFPYSETEIVGFDGSMAADCGSALPVLRHRLTHLYFKPSPKDFAESFVTARSSFSEGEIASFAAEGRLTRLPEALKAFPHARVIYLTEALRTAGDIRLSSDIVWFALPHFTSNQRAWVACVTEQIFKRLSDTWGQELMVRGEKALAAFLCNRDEVYRQEAERLAQLALCAAQNRSLRGRIWWRYGVAMAHSERKEVLHRMYDLFVRKEFPEWTWEDYVKDVHHLTSVISIDALSGEL